MSALHGIIPTGLSMPAADPLSPDERGAMIEAGSLDLVHHASLLTRLAYRRVDVSLSRSEVTILSTISDGPQRITTLAELEGLAQPTVTQLVKRLEARGLVTRERQSGDGRVVMVALTSAGNEMLETVRDRYRPVLQGAMSQLTDDELLCLRTSNALLTKLVEALQSDDPM